MASNHHSSRRRWLQQGIGTGCLMAAGEAQRQSWATVGEATVRLRVDPRPRHELSPYLFMQFMEPLGTNDSSVEASWDHLRDRWRPSLIEATRALAPPMMRWGGLFAAYYRWREAVGPRDQRVPMANIMWGGIESNQIGTAEFIDFCRAVGSEALLCVNFESEGRSQFRSAKGVNRSGSAEEAAAWVAYCNQPSHPLRSDHGSPEPYMVRYWQIGNETSYGKNGFDLETAAIKTRRFAVAMRQADPSLRLIGWGDNGWAERMGQVAGDQLDYLAFHHMFNPDPPDQPVLHGEGYRRDPLASWQVLMEAWRINDAKIRQVRESAGSTALPLAMTECHFSIPGNHRNDVLRTWAAGVAYARILNNHQRHGDVLKIATAADFCGTRWSVNAILLGTHPERTFLMPVARVMQQYRQHLGKNRLEIVSSDETIDAVASRTEDTIFVNLVNTQRDRSQTLHLAIEGATILAGEGKMLVDDPMTEISSLNCNQVMQPKSVTLSPQHTLEFPPAAVASLAIRFQA
jgi:alpha-N-arabinofuranosidase